MLKELYSYFQIFSSHSRLVSLPAPHEIGQCKSLEYQRHYSILNHIGVIHLEHDDFALCFAATMNRLMLSKFEPIIDAKWSKEVKGNMYDIVVEGFRLLSRWIGHVWEQCAWKFSRPCKDVVPLDPDDLSANISDYEKVVRCNYSHEERRAMVELTPELEDMAFPVEDVVAALSTFSLEDDQPDVQGLSIMLSMGRYATKSAIDYEDVPTYHLSLMEDTNSINQLNVLVQEGK